MTRETIKRDLIAKTARLLFCDEEEIETDVSLTDELGLDSIELQDLSLAISKKYDVDRNLFRIVNDAAVILDRGAEEDPDKLIAELENAAKITLSSENRENFKKCVQKESRGRLLYIFQSYLTIDMIADSIIRELEIRNESEAAEK